MAPARGRGINGAALRALREANGWTLTKFAIATRVSTGYLSNIESGRKERVGPEVAVRFASALDVPLAAITSAAYPADVA
jgi:transcriptional regulator with XRE-family HTH domain